MSPKPPALVFETSASEKQKPYIGIDCVRCRKNALANGEFDFPVFCPFDSIREAEEGVLCDMSYVSIPNTKRFSELTLLPYIGPGWYGKPAVAFMLKNNICKWADIKWSLEASSHIPKKAFRDVLSVMENAWPQEHEHMAKISINAMIGLWAKSTSTLYSVKSSMIEVDGAGCTHK